MRIRKLSRSYLFKEEISCPVTQRKTVARITHSSYIHARNTYMLQNRNHTDLLDKKYIIIKNSQKERERTF